MLDILKNFTIGLAILIIIGLVVECLMWQPYIVPAAILLFLAVGIGDFLRKEIVRTV